MGSCVPQSSAQGQNRPGVPCEPLSRPWVKLALRTCSPVPCLRVHVNSAALSGFLTLSLSPDPVDSDTGQRQQKTRVLLLVRGRHQNLTGVHHRLIGWQWNSTWPGQTRKAAWRTGNRAEVGGGRGGSGGFGELKGENCSHPSIWPGIEGVGMLRVQALGTWL